MCVLAIRDEAKEYKKVSVSAAAYVCVRILISFDIKNMVCEFSANSCVGRSTTISTTTTQQ